MATTLEIINNFTLTCNGIETVGKQGNITDAITDAYSITAATISGTQHLRNFSIATSTIVTLYDASNDYPATWDYLYLWTDQAVYLQLITSATNVSLKTLAKVPFVLSVGSLLAAASTTVLAAEPTLAAITKVAVANYSGSTVTGVLAIID